MVKYNFTNSSLMKYCYSFVITFLVSIIIAVNFSSHSNVNVFGIVTSANQSQSQSKTGEIELVGNVTHVVDGDTIDINGIRIRLSLVDTPERGQPGFKEAKDYVTTLCLGKKGELDVDDGQRRGDRYGREIGVIYCNDVNINEKLVKEHLARILTNFCEVSEFSKEKWAAACINPDVTVIR